MITRSESESLIADVIDLEEFKLPPPSAALVNDAIERGFSTLLEKASPDLRPMIWALGFLSCYQGAKSEGLADDEMGQYAGDCCVLVLNRVLDGEG